MPDDRLQPNSPEAKENSMSTTPTELAHLLSTLHSTILKTYLPTPFPPPPLPSPSTLEAAANSLISSLPPTGLGLLPTITHLQNSLLTALNSQSHTPHYYGFVTGGTTPAALLADMLVTLADQNVQVHLPNDSLSTVIEDRALCMLLELFRLDPGHWKGRIFTTGATGSNILGLACGREYLLARKLELAHGGRESTTTTSVAELGILGACAEAGVTGIEVLSAAPHSSILKAAAVLGIGRANVKDISLKSPSNPWEFDLQALESHLKASSERGVVSIIVVGFGEINTGRFTSNLRGIREVVDRYGRGWIHVDAAFGIFARVLDDCSVGGLGECARVWGDGIELADSISADGHKLLNVPYDCGIFFTPHPHLLTSNFLNSAPYLTPPSTINNHQQPSPLNLTLENSRRFRALPVYATLTAYGLTGYRELITRLVTHARGIARWIYRHPEYQLLPLEEEGGGGGGREGSKSEDEIVERVFIVVLFRAKREEVNVHLKERICENGRIFVSGTVWKGRKAVRIAVGNWRVAGTREAKEGGWGVVEEVLEKALCV